MYYLRTYEDINYYRLHRNPDSNYTIGKLYSVVDDSLAIQELLLNFMKANRPFKEKVKSFVQNHPMLVNVSIRIGAAIVFAGISELLLDALDSAGVDPSLWFIPDGDTGDTPLLTDDGFDTGDYVAETIDSGNYTEDAPSIDHDGYNTEDTMPMTDVGNNHNIAFDGGEIGYYQDKLKSANKDIDYYTGEISRSDISDTYRNNCKHRLEQAIKKSEDYAKKIAQLSKKT